MVRAHLSGTVTFGQGHKGSKGVGHVDMRVRGFQAEEQQVQSSVLCAEGQVVKETDIIMDMLLNLSFYKSGRH